VGKIALMSREIGLSLIKRSKERKMKLWTMSIATMFSLLFAYEAKAESSALDQCIKACEAQLKLICFDESNRDITTLCGNIPACASNKLSSGEKSAASALLGACYEGVTNHCPSNCPPAEKSGAQSTAGGAVAPARKPVTSRPATKQDACKAVGGFYLTEPGGTVKFCYSHQAMYEQILGIESRLNDLENRAQGFAKQGQPVPADISNQYEAQIQLLKNIDKTLVGYNKHLHQMSNRIIEYAEHFNGRLTNLERRMDGAEAMASAAMGLAEEVKKSEKAFIEPALMGWSVNPYYTYQSFTLYDEFMGAGGLEAGLYPSLSANGRHRAVVVFGGGKASDYFQKNMLEMHLFGGYRYSSESGSISIGAATHRYSRTDVQQGRLFWIGRHIEGRLNIVDLSDLNDPVKGYNLYILGRVGAGYRYGRHGILDPKFEPVQGRFDVPILFGIGIENVPFL
jgi:hypothetical protein